MKGFIVLDKGHLYRIKNIDGDDYQNIQFVKRIGGNFPGNTGQPEQGVTLQFVLRMCIDRIAYLQQQKPCLENKIIILALSLAIWLLEFRAARRHKIFYFKALRFAVTADCCDSCGHTVCNCGMPKINNK